MHAHAHAIVLTYAHALKLTRADAVTRSCAAAPELVGALGLGTARALADAIAGDLAAAVDRAYTRAAELAQFIDLDLSVLSAFDFDVAHAVELHRAHTWDLDRAHVLARGMQHDPALSLASVLGLASAGGLEPALALPGILGLPLRWVADGPLTSTLLQVLAANSAAAASTSTASGPQPGDPHLAFAQALASRAGIEPATPLRAALGSPLTDRLRELTTAASRKEDGTPDWSQATALRRLTDACEPMSAAHTPPDPVRAAALRAVALALAGDADLPGADAAGLLRTVAATVTTVENRSGGTATVGESVVLAVV